MMLLFFLFVTLFTLQAMEEQTELLSPGSKVTGYSSSLSVLSFFQQAKELQSRPHDDEWYMGTKKILKEIKTHPIFESDVIEGIPNPFYKASALIADFPCQAKVSNVRTVMCGLYEVQSLSVKNIKEHLGEYCRATHQLMDKDGYVQEFSKEDCGEIRKATLDFLKLRVSKYHEEKLVCSDAIVPTCCCLCGSADCVGAATAFATGHPIMGIVFFVASLLETSFSTACCMSLLKENEPRCQELRMSSQDFKRLRSLKKLLNAASHEHTLKKNN